MYLKLTDARLFSNVYLLPSSSTRKETRSFCVDDPEGVHDQSERRRGMTDPKRHTSNQVPFSFQV